MKKLIRSSATAIYSTQIAPKILEIWVVDDARRCSASVAAADEAAETREGLETEKTSKDMKIDKTESNEDETVLVSFHSAEFEDDKPYSSANNKEDN